VLDERLLPHEHPFGHAAVVREPPSRILVTRPEDEHLHSALRLFERLSADAAGLCAVFGQSQDNPQPDTTFLSFPLAARFLGVRLPLSKHLRRKTQASRSAREAAHESYTSDPNG
jgi:hypothetical protein